MPPKPSLGCYVVHIAWHAHKHKYYFCLLGKTEKTKSLRLTNSCVTFIELILHTLLRSIGKAKLEPDREWGGRIERRTNKHRKQSREFNFSRNIEHCMRNTTVKHDTSAICFKIFARKATDICIMTDFSICRELFTVFKFPLLRSIPETNRTGRINVATRVTIPSIDNLQLQTKLIKSYRKSSAINLLSTEPTINQPRVTRLDKWGWEKCDACTCETNAGKGFQHSHISDHEMDQFQFAFSPPSGTKATPNTKTLCLVELAESHITKIAVVRVRLSELKRIKKIQMELQVR